MKEGYIKIHRRFFDSKVWKAAREYSKAEAWVDLIQMARFEPSETSSWMNDRLVKWTRGQVPASFRFLSERWGWSTKKVGTYLEYLQDDGSIKKETQKETGITIITLCKYDEYNPINSDWKQEMQQQRNGEETLGKQQRNETNKDNKGNKGKNRNTKVFLAPTLDEVKKFFADKGYSDEAAVKAYNHYALADWHDTHGNKVKNWKQKMNTNWFKPENKVQTGDGKKRMVF